jgi:hypothetical protein
MTCVGCCRRAKMDSPWCQQGRSRGRSQEAGQGNAKKHTHFIHSLQRSAVQQHCLCHGSLVCLQACTSTARMYAL